MATRTPASSLSTAPPAETSSAPNRPRSAVPAPRVLSGITPSGSLTLGNYLGALRRFVGAQAEQAGFFFVADLHAMTSPHQPGRLRALTQQTSALFIAAGLDPDQSVVFVQSHVAAHVRLAYLLECTAHVGELSRMIQFKQKADQPGTRASLFTYPCLMAADILLYDTDRVPVGGDQNQHVELCRDLAMRFNRLYGDTFVVPELAPAELAARVADLSEPTSKMSKSAPQSAAGVIRMLDDPAAVGRKVGRAVTDSDTDVRYDPLAKPGVSNLLEIIAALSGTAPSRVAEDYSSYGQLKRDCADVVIEALTPIQRRYADLNTAPGELAALLESGAVRARQQADMVLARAAAAIGLS